MIKMDLPQPGKSSPDNTLFISEDGKNQSHTGRFDAHSIKKAHKQGTFLSRGLTSAAVTNPHTFVDEPRPFCSLLEGVANSTKKY